MYHYPHIFFIDTHTKGVGANHNPHFARLPRILLTCLDLWREQSVKVIATKSKGIEEVGDLLGLFTASHINECTPLNTGEDMYQFPSFILCLSYHIGEGSAVKALFEEATPLLKE